MKDTGKDSSANKTPPPSGNVSARHDTIGTYTVKDHPHYFIPDDVAAEIVTELREIENVAHE